MNKCLFSRNRSYTETTYSTNTISIFVFCIFQILIDREISDKLELENQLREKTRQLNDTKILHEQELNIMNRK